MTTFGSLCWLAHVTVTCSLNLAPEISVHFQNTRATDRRPWNLNLLSTNDEWTTINPYKYWNIHRSCRIWISLHSAILHRTGVLIGRWVWPAAEQFNLIHESVFACYEQLIVVGLISLFFISLSSVIICNSMSLHLLYCTFEWRFVFLVRTWLSDVSCLCCDRRHAVIKQINKCSPSQPFDQRLAAIRWQTADVKYICEMNMINNGP